MFESVPFAAWGVIAAYALMAASNTLAQKKFFGGKDNKVISDEHPTYVSPDGLTFAIWGLIYLAELVLVVAQAFFATSESVKQVFASPCPLTGLDLDVRMRLIGAFLANAVWLPVFNNEKFWTALIIMAIYFGFLLSAYISLNPYSLGTPSFVYTLGLSMNLSWIVVAFSLSIFFCGGLAGWNTEKEDQSGVVRKVAGTAKAASVVMMLVCFLACHRAYFGQDLGYAFVGAWALRGIYRMQTIPDKVRFPLAIMNHKLAGFASALCYVVLLVMAFSWYEHGLCC